MQPQPGILGRTPSLFDKRTAFFYMHYTTNGTSSFTSHRKDEAMVKCLAQGHSVTAWDSNWSVLLTARPQHFRKEVCKTKKCVRQKSLTTSNGMASTYMLFIFNWCHLFLQELLGLKFEEIKKAEVWNDDVTMVKTMSFIFKRFKNSLHRQFWKILRSVYKVPASNNSQSRGKGIWKPPNHWCCLWLDHKHFR